MESPTPPSPRLEQQAARIAIVDDDPLSCAIEAHLVSLLGHHALVETAPELAIARALQGEFDLMLLDLEMPGLDGFETLRRLRQAEAEAMQKRPALAVIAVTGYTSEQDRLHCLMNGFADHVGKPIQIEQLEQALLRVLRGRAGAAARRDGGSSDAQRLRQTVRRLAEARPAQGLYGPTLMESFALRAQQLLESLRQALRELDAGQVVHNARALRSLAEFLGVTRLALMCAQIEQDAMPEQWEAARQTLEQIERENQAVLALLFESAR